MILSEIISSLLLLGNGVSSDVPIDDYILNSYENLSYNEILKHHRSYSDLLGNYVESSNINLTLKIIFKIIFFAFSLYIWYLMMALFKDSLEFSFDLLSTENNLDVVQIGISMVGTILPPLISLITSFIVIPEIIARYLFDTGEEKSLIKIIKSVQTYDNNIYKDKVKSELIAHENVKLDENNNDNSNSAQDVTNSNQDETEIQPNEELDIIDSDKI